MKPEEIERSIEDLLGQLTLKEKVFLLSGSNNWATQPVDRPLTGAPHGIPPVTMTDGPHGVRANQPDIGRTTAPHHRFPHRRLHGLHLEPRAGRASRTRAG